MSAITLGRKIKTIRTLRGWTMAELGKRAGITRNPISEYESGQRVPKPSTLAAIEKAFGLELDSLLVNAAFGVLANNSSDPEMVEFAIIILETYGDHSASNDRLKRSE